MQSPDTNSRTAGAVNHPEAAVWMTFLYGEVSAAQQRELDAHLKQCPACAAQVKAWRNGMTSLDTWILPASKPARATFPSMLKWAAAAAVVLALGIFLGRQTSHNTAEIAALQATVKDLAAQVQRQADTTMTNTLVAANAQTVQLLADFSRLQETQRAGERQAVNLTLQGFNTRIERLRTELETVAVNTQTGFEATRQDLVRVASLNTPSSQSNN